jgi:hypothetical protein
MFNTTTFAAIPIGGEFIEVFTTCNEVAIRIFPATYQGKPVNAKRAGGKLIWMEEWEPVFYEKTSERDRVTQTIDRLISNLPQAIDQLRAYGLTSLPRQLQNDLENLVYWQKNGELINKPEGDIEMEKVKVTATIYWLPNLRQSHSPRARIGELDIKCDHNKVIDGFRGSVVEGHIEGCPEVLLGTIQKSNGQIALSSEVDTSEMVFVPVEVIEPA